MGAETEHLPPLGSDANKLEEFLRNSQLNKPVNIFCFLGPYAYYFSYRKYPSNMLLTSKKQQLVPVSLSAT